MSELKLADARRIIEAGEVRATEIGQPQNLAVVDGGGNLVAHVRMDGAWIGSVDISPSHQRDRRPRTLNARPIERTGGPPKRNTYGGPPTIRSLVVQASPQQQQPESGKPQADVQHLDSGGLPTWATLLGALLVHIGFLLV